MTAAAALLLAALTGNLRPEDARERDIAHLQERAAHVVPGSREAAGLAAQLESLGAAYLNEGDAGRASELLSEAYALDESNGLVLAELTLCYLEAEDYEAARFYLRRAEEHVASAPPEVYGALGEAYLALHRLDDAVAAWEEFLRFGGSDPVLLARLARAREELAVSRGQRSLTLDHFNLFADLGVDESVVREAGASLEESYAAQDELIGEDLGRRQVVVLYAGRSYFSLVSVPEWSSGLFDGKIRVCVPPGALSADALRPVLAHELAHALLRRRVGDQAPDWLHEGLAQWCEGRRLPVRDVSGAVGPRPPASAEQLDRVLSGRLSRAAARASYAQALSLVEFLVEKRGTGALGCVLTRLAEQGGSFAAALSAETGWTPVELFVAWRRWAGVAG